MSSSLNFSKKLILFTIIYNLLEGVFALYFGIDENSTSLLSFGIDSFIEIFASTIALLGLSIKSNLSEKFAEKLIAYSFLLLVVFILFKSTYDMINSYRPEPSFYGILIAIVSILVEGPLAYKKLKIGKESNNLIIIAEAKETLFCLNLSVLVIVGVGVNYLTNLWYFDPVAALLMIPWLIYEFNQHR